MENATQALLIAAGVLIGIMILSLGVALYAELDSYVQSSHENIEFTELNKFNTQFTNYINYVNDVKQFDLTIQDIVTVANLAYQNNLDNGAEVTERESENSLYVAVYLNNKPIEYIISGNVDDPKLTSTEEEKLTATALLNTELNKDTKYKCNSDDIKFSNATGRVYAVYFEEE